MIGKELDNDAQIWDIYVEETDRFDKELVKEWSESLDVLLSPLVITATKTSNFHLQAALFSAITTALVIESCKQLQPDRSEATEQTLLFISQTLVAISNGQSVGSSNPTNPFPPFLPSRSMIVVNALWFLSLGLSVAVSLVAMLSKSWCSSFMSRRSGPKYEQGRRRQHKWTGIEWWGMQSMFLYLPVLIHLALLLFAIGLALYLWDINMRVACPVVGLVATSVLLYATATFLPLVYEDCPYSTPLSKLFKYAPDTALLLGRLTLGAFKIMQANSLRLMKRTPVLGLLWDRLQLLPLFRWLSEIVKTWAKRQSMPVDTDEFTVNSTLGDETQMDKTTSRMLLWLLQYCEGQRLVDIALQSMAGACRELPRAPLVESNVLELLVQRLDNCFVKDSNQQVLRLKHSASISSVLLYTRALTWLTTSDTAYGLPFDEWSKDSNKLSKVYSQVKPNKILAGFYKRSIHRYSDSHDSIIDPNLNAAVIAITTPAVHYHSKWTMLSRVQLTGLEDNTRNHRLWRSFLGRAFIVKDIGRRSMRCIENHLNGSVTSQNSALLVLLETAPDWIIVDILRLNKLNRRQMIMTMVGLVHAPVCAPIEFQHAIGLTLAIIAMLMHPYPGWKRSLIHDSDFIARAIEVYKYHKTRRYKHSQLLIVFGLLGLLREPEGCGFDDNDIVVISGMLERMNGLVDLEPCLHTLPVAFSFERITIETAIHYIQGLLNSEPLHSETTVGRVLQRLSKVTPHIFQADNFELGLKLFCTTRNMELRKICWDVLHLSISYTSEKMGFYLKVILGRIGDLSTFDRLIDISLGSEGVHIAPSVMIFLWNLMEHLATEAIESPEGPMAPLLALAFQSRALTQHLSSLNSNSSPRNVYETGLAEAWYPLLEEMCGWSSTARAVQDSSILLHMSYLLEYNQEVLCSQSWRERIRELQRLCDTTLAGDTR
ncbi:phosphatidylinositol phosphatase PTPRQ [Ceratobasidium sp. AG-Ba]|nr:phosphatidylinositol phosphatase PTPRQ [Ceratobasidium sp. AG-Ba]